MDIEELCKKCGSRLREKIRLLDGYKEATARIKEALESKDVVRLDRHLKERQGVIAKIERIDKEVDKYLQGNDFSLDKLSEKARNLVGGYLDRIKTALESLSGLDRECLELARAEHDCMKSEILKMQHGRRTARGYRATCRQAPRFLDTKR